MLAEYSKIKTDLCTSLDELGNIAVGKQLQTSVQLLQKKLLSETFSLVIVGQFKRGKTTFINALLGQDVLPTSVIPFTSIITILNYGEELKIVVFFKKIEKKIIALADLDHYVTEKYNPKNIKEVDRVEITYPSSYLKRGVQIIDTPGVASIHQHNTQTTYEYLPKADAAIFLLSVDPPLTQAELDFLRDLKKIVSKIFFVQNKIDTVSADEWAEALAFSKKAIEQKAGFKDIKIYPLSAKNALAAKIKANQTSLSSSGLSNFERRLELFLMEEKGEVLIRSSAERIMNFINQEFLLAEIEKKSFSLSLQELNNKIKNFKIFIKDLDQERLDSDRLFQAEITNLQKVSLVEDLEQLKQDKTTHLLAKISKFADSLAKENNRKFAASLEEFISINIKDLFKVWRIKEEESLKEQISLILGRFVKRLDIIIEKIFSSSAELLGITQRKISRPENLVPKIEFRFQVKDEDTMLSIIIDTVKKILPRAIAHKLILKEAKSQLVQLIDRHCGKSHYDFSRRLNKLVQEYRTTLGNNVKLIQEDVLKSLESGVKAKQETSDKAQQEELVVNNRLMVLEKLKDSIQKIQVLINK